MDKNGKKLPDYVAFASVKTDKVGEDGYPIRRRTRYGVAFDNRNSEGKGPIRIISDLSHFDIELWPPFVEDENKEKDSSPKEEFDENAVDLSKPAF